jgi:hypothetical protein
MSKRLKWYTISGMPVSFGLTTNPKVMKNFGTLAELDETTNMGLTTNKGSKSLVWINPAERYKKGSLGTIIHEAVHVFQNICSYIQEDDPSAEWEAYTIEYIATSLIK